MMVVREQRLSSVRGRLFQYTRRSLVRVLRESRLAPVRSLILSLEKWDAPARCSQDRWLGLAKSSWHTRYLRQMSRACRRRYLLERTRQKGFREPHGYFHAQDQDGLRRPGRRLTRPLFQLDRQCAPSTR